MTNDGFDTFLSDVWSGPYNGSSEKQVIMPVRLKKRSKLERIVRLPKVAYKNYRLFRKAGTSIYRSALGSVLLSYWSIKA